MKKLITLILLAFTIASFAQRNSGFKVGYSIGWVSPTVTAVIPNSEAMYETSSLNEMLFGYSWNIHLGGNYSIQTAFVYNWKGGVINIKDSYEEKSPNIYGGYSSVVYYPNFECFSFPVSLNYMVYPHLYIELGLEPSLSPIDAADKSYDFGVVAGVCYSTKYVDLSLRYLHGLTPHTVICDTYLSDSTSSIHTEYSQKFRTMQVSLIIPVFKYFNNRD